MTYGTRLEEALRLAGKTRQELATALGISPQAIGQVIKGNTQALTAENSSHAARFLRVDGHWLATGEGDAKLAGPDWPFSLIDRGRYEALSPEQRGFIQGGLERLIGEQEALSASRKTGTNR